MLPQQEEKEKEKEKIKNLKNTKKIMHILKRRGHIFGT